MSILKRSLAGLGAVVLGVGAVAFSAPASVAAPAGSLSTECQTSTFPKFAWTPSVDAVATGDGTTTNLTLQLSDLPGVVPLSLTDLDMVGTVDVTVNGEAKKLTGKSKINIEAAKPFKIPAVSLSFPSAATELDVVITKLSYDIPSYTMNTLCPAGTATASYPLDKITVTQGTPPTTPPDDDDDKDDDDKDDDKVDDKDKNKDDDKDKDQAKSGKPASGTVTFGCVLSAPFNTPFDYKAAIKVSGVRATADDSKVSLAATFSQIPGLAPVPIDNGSMTITAKGTVDGKAATFTGDSVVNAGIKAPVPVPTLSSSVTTSEEKAAVTFDSFRFEFGEMNGLKISADCEAKSGKLSDMTVGIGELPKDDDGNDNNDNNGNTGTPNASLPVTGGGDSLPVIGLWALALGVVGAALLVWMPRQRRSTT